MRWKLGVVLLVTAVSLAWVVYGMDVHAAGAALASFRAVWLVPIAVLFTMTWLARSLRFWVLLDAPVAFLSVLTVNAAGFLAINTVPLRMGELVRPYLLYEEHDVPVGTSMAAVVLERLLDMLALITLLAAVAFTVELPEGGLVVGGVDLLQAGQRVVGTMLAVGLCGAAGLVVVGEPAVSLAARVTGVVSPRLAEGVERLGERFVGGFRALVRNPARGAIAFLCTAVVWVGTLFAVACCMAGFASLEPTVDRVLFNWGATMTGIVLGPTPGFLGPFEAASMGSLVLVGADADVARAFALTMHACVFGYTAITGAGALLIEGWSLVGVVRASSTVAERTT